MFDTGQLERLWVLISEKTVEGTLIGTIANTPALNVGVRGGDMVEVQVGEIEAVY